MHVCVLSGRACTADCLRAGCLVCYHVRLDLYAQLGLYVVLELVLKIACCTVKFSAADAACLQVALSATIKLDLGTTLLFSGLYNVVSGVTFQIPMCVQVGWRPKHLLGQAHQHLHLPGWSQL